MFNLELYLTGGIIFFELRDMSVYGNHAGIRCRGWILAGGASRRMGRDKALLERDGEPLLLRLARLIETVAPPVTVVAPPDRYRHLGLPVIPDLHPGCGPLGGIETALSSTGAQWNLILACDMPGLSAAYLQSLIQALPAAEACDALVSRAGGESEPLCAIYHRRLLPQVTAARAAGHLRVRDLLDSVQVQFLDVPQPGLTASVNTPEEWQRSLAARN